MSAVTDHIRSASSELLRAADLIRQEIDQLRTDDINIKNMLEKQATELAATANLREQEAIKTDDDTHRSTVQTMARYLRAQVFKVKQQQREEQKRIADLIREKENQFNALSNQARNLI